MQYWLLEYQKKIRATLMEVIQSCRVIHVTGHIGILQYPELGQCQLISHAQWTFSDSNCFPVLVSTKCLQKKKNDASQYITSRKSVNGKFNITVKANIQDYTDMHGNVWMYNCTT